MTTKNSTQPSLSLVRVSDGWSGTFHYTVLRDGYRIGRLFRIPRDGVLGAHAWTWETTDGEQTGVTQSRAAAARALSRAVPEGTR